MKKFKTHIKTILIIGSVLLAFISNHIMWIHIGLINSTGFLLTDFYMSIILTSIVLIIVAGFFFIYDKIYQSLKQKENNGI